MKLFLIGLGVGLFLGYLICDLLTKENSIVYHIKRLRAKEGSSITVEAEATQTRKQARKLRRDSRKNK
jgi:hypothetical protein